MHQDESASVPRAVQEVAGQRWGAAQRTFVLDEAVATAGDVRIWLREEVFPAVCTAVDDMCLVVSELLANCCEHGNGAGTRVTLLISHSPRNVQGLLLHHAPPVGEPARSAATAEQTARLLHDDGLPEDMELLENGRGLIVVEALTEEFAIVQRETSTSANWTVAPCGCA